MKLSYHKSIPFFSTKNVRFYFKQFDKGVLICLYKTVSDLHLLCDLNFYFSPSVRFFLLSWLFSATKIEILFCGQICLFGERGIFVTNLKSNSDIFLSTGSSILLYGTTTRRSRYTSTLHAPSPRFCALCSFVDSKAI